MAKKKYEESNIQAIAETIRSKTGTDTTYDTSEMPAGVNEVYDKGRTDEWSDFWDAFQLNGARSNYQYAFNVGFDNKTFKPKYDIKPSDATHMFSSSPITGDFRSILEECNVVLDTSKATYMQYAFNNAWAITHLPEISFESATYSYARIEGVFMGCYALKRIDKVIYPTEKHQPTTNTFQSCKTLSYLRIGGVIGNNFNVSWSPLDVESVKDVILHLKDYSTDTENKGKYTLTLSDTSKTAMSALGTIPEFNNKTYDAYLTDIGWNLA